jgi:uncharacterized protein
MSRLLFFVAIAVVVYLLLKSYRKNSTPPQTPPQSEDMVRCLQCGVHVPKSESVQDNGQNFCCAAHRDAFRKQSQ